MPRTAEKGYKRQRNCRTTLLHTHIYKYCIYIYYLLYTFWGNKPFCSVAIDPKKRKRKTQRSDLFADQAYEREVHQQRFMDDDLEAGDRSIPVLLHSLLLSMSFDFDLQ